MSLMDYKVTTGRDGKRAFVNVYVNGKRFRFANGKSINVDLKASENLDLLQSAFELKLLEGWRPETRKIPKNVKKSQSFIEELTESVNAVQSGHYSYHHKRDCRWVLKEWTAYSSKKNLNASCRKDLRKEDFTSFVNQSKWSKRTQKNVLTTLKCLIKDERLKSVKIKRPSTTLHKPIKDIQSLLNDIKQYNDSLYLCCLLTYGCLLRPHQEIRLLKWSDVDLDRGLISLSGSRNKSGRNRIVPVPNYIKAELADRYTKRDRYVLRDSLKPYSRDYLKVLWRRYKQQSSCLEDGVTLYSFRHSGSVKVFEKTGSLQKLQQVMGHSTLQVSLSYLRNLEVNNLDVEDLPELATIQL